MSSRREFLAAGAFAAPMYLEAMTSSDEPAAASQNTAARDFWNDFPQFLSVKVKDARARRKADLSKVTTPEQAASRIQAVREKAWDLIGGRLEKTPLHPKVTGVVTRRDYRIEKIIFESQPGFYVPAHLYLPGNGNGPFPGVLAPLGHTSDGKLYPSYQTLFQNLARKGFAVLAWDPPGQGERVQYLNLATGGSLFGPTGEHDRFGWPALLIGSSTTQFEAWDGIRALDYLLSRPEIDAKRIGCCGHSGGGTQTMWLCALEPRIHVAVVVEGHTENLAGANYQPPGAFADAEQNLIGGLKAGLDRGDLLYAFVPKPLLICFTPIDEGTTYSPTYIQGTHEIFDELQSVYALHDARDKSGLFSSVLPHDYDYFHRRATYEWLGRWLGNGKVDAEETAFEDAPQSTLWCTATGQVLTSLGGRRAFEVNADRLQTKQRRAAQEHNATQIRSGLTRVLGLTHTTGAVKHETLSSRVQRTVLIEEIVFESEPGIRVPGWFLKPTNGTSKFPVVVIIDEDGRDRLFDDFDRASRLLSNGYAICAVDVRTLGVMTPRLPSAGPLFYGYGVQLAYSLVSLSAGWPIIGQQTVDLLRTLDYLESRPDVDVSRIGFAANGRMGAVAMFAAAVDRRPRSVYLERSLADFQSVVASETYTLPLSSFAFGLLPEFDLPEICSILAPRKTWFLNSVGADGRVLPLSEIRSTYKAAQGAYDAAGKTESLSFVIEPGSTETLLSKWAQDSLA